MFPHTLAKAAKELKAKVLQIETDCVYSGKKGKYKEADLQDFQARLDQEQSLWWAVARPGLPQKYEAKIRFLPYGQDSLDGQRGVLVAGPVGDLQILSIAQLELQGTGWLLQDLEARPELDDIDETIWLPLNRKVVGITPREDRSPMLYEFAREGGLDHCGLHIALSGEALEYNISHLTRPTLQMLGWIDQTK